MTVLFFMFLHEDETEDVNKHSNMAIVYYLYPFVTKEMTVQRLAINLPIQVIYYAKDGLQTVSKLFLNAYINVHSSDYKEVIVAMEVKKHAHKLSDYMDKVQCA